MKQGEAIGISDITSFEGIDMVDDDRDAAHITVLYKNGTWVLLSDPRFNQRTQRAQQAVLLRLPQGPAPARESRASPGR